VSEELCIGTPPIAVSVRRRSNARRLTLRISPDGPILTIPKRFALNEAKEFLLRKEGWLREKLANQPEKQSLAQSTSIPIEGVERQIAQGTGRRCQLFEDRIEVPGTPDKYAPKIRGFLKEHARVKLHGASEYYADKINRTFEKITLRDTRSRWGSCTSSGNLMYSWRLIMAPPEVLNYVAAHEVAHLSELNHSDKFWSIVEELDPNWRQSRNWLRENGQKLHAFNF